MNSNQDTERSTKENAALEGLTGRVLGGSTWAIVGTAVPFVATFFSSPFVIRLLGPDGYGVLVLIGMIPNYASFALLGMGMASTKFGGDARAEEDLNGERKVFWTAGIICITSLSICVLPIIIFSHQIALALKIPDEWLFEASVAIKIASVGMVLTSLSFVANTPQIVRLRLDLNTLINSSGKVLGAVSVPLALWMGGKVIAAAAVGAVASSLTLIAELLVSGKLVRGFGWPSFNKDLARRLLRYGLPLTLAGAALIVLTNLDRLVLTQYVSIEMIAYYSVAAMLARMVRTLSFSVTRAITPAFVLLQKPEKRNELEDLFERLVRANLIWAVPAAVAMSVLAEPFFSIWAGPEFGANSPLPFYILVCGLLVDVYSYVPMSSILAKGRTDLPAKINWALLGPYVVLLVILISNLGIVGAALAWSVRMAVSGLAFTFAARSSTGLSFPFRKWLGRLVVCALPLVLPALLTSFADASYLLILPSLLLSLSIYAFAAWRLLVLDEEKAWLIAKTRKLF
ncbi:MAG: flippase [Acidobacteria bacterium]|nr:MAG: flippase [Acidobacteriota bacterium]REJ99093.1 MAG: flippase [Acidobacteriota bacterium]REK16187.1 MAG: flippase [Acidobacteriota bacterium]REK43868.1 MAG: flippase [Acidobacteriota bacterium]